MTSILRQTQFVPPTLHAIASHLGLFAEEDVQLEMSATRSSDQQREELLSGEQDLAVTAMDNLLIWNDRGGDFTLLAQIERTTPLGLYARPQARGPMDLAGCRFAVDAAHNGFAIIAKHALQDVNVDYVEVGGVRERLEALLNGTADATLLGPPLDEMAEDAGFAKVLNVNDHYPDYPGQGLVVRRSRIPELLPLLVPYLAALNRTVMWAEGASNDQGVSVLRAAGFGERSSLRAWEVRPADLIPSTAGLLTIVRLREDLGRLPASFPGIDSLWEPVPLEKASAKPTVPL